MKITFAVQGVPQPKKRAKSRLIKTPTSTFISTYKHPKTAAAEESFIARAIAHKPPAPLTAPIVLTLLFVLPVPKAWPRRRILQLADREIPHVSRPDLDNLEKLVKDAMNGVFWSDDQQVCGVTKRKIYGLEPRTEVTIEEIFDPSVPVPKQEVRHAPGCDRRHDGACMKPLEAPF